MESFGAIAVEPYMVNDHEMTLAFVDAEHAEQAVASLNEVSFSVDLVMGPLIPLLGG